MNDALLSAVRDGKAWLARFTRTEYAEAFREYQRRYGSACREAIRVAGNPDALTESLLDALADGWARETFWKRSARRFEEKQMIFCYLSPMLLDMGETAFAECLREAWRKRWPKDAYQTATWRKLQDGFRLTVMGLELRRTEDGD